MQWLIQMLVGITKNDLFSSYQNELASMAKAFSNPARVAIIQHLLSINACINSDLVIELGLAQATISQHLQELKKIGVIRGVIEGAKINYCIDAERWLEIKNQFMEIFNQLEQEQSCRDC